MLRRLDKERPLFGLQMPGMLPGSTTRSGHNATELADDYIDQIRLVQPEGPYHLIGWSFGGNLVHRLATRLQELGHEVAFSGHPGCLPDTGKQCRYRHGAGTVAELPAGGRLPWPDEETAELDGARVLEMLRENHNALGSIPLASLDAMVDNFPVLARMIREAQVQRSTGICRLPGHRGGPRRDAGRAVLDAVRERTITDTPLRAALADAQ